MEVPSNMTDMKEIIKKDNDDCSKEQLRYYIFIGAMMLLSCIGLAVEI